MKSLVKKIYFELVKEQKIVNELFGFGNKKYHDKVFGDMIIDKKGVYKSIKSLFKNAKVYCHSQPEEEHYKYFNLVKTNFNKIMHEAIKIEKDSFSKWFHMASKSDNKQYENISDQEVIDKMRLEIIELNKHHQIIDNSKVYFEDVIWLHLLFPEEVDPEHVVTIQVKDNGTVKFVSING